MKVNIDGAGAPAPYQLTLTSGTSLDPRFVARDIQRKLQAYSSVNNGFKYAQVEFVNRGTNGYGQFVIKSGTTGGSSAVTVTDGDSTVLTTLGMNTLSETTGNAYHKGTTTSNSAYAGTVTVSGTYQGIFDDYYRVVATSDLVYGTPAFGGGNTYGVSNAGACSVGGDWNYDSDNTYVITIDTTNGSTMGGGTGNVPTFTVTMSTGSGDTVGTAQELLFADTWYVIGTRGLRIKLTDYPFGNGDTITIACTAATVVDGASSTGSVGVAKVVWDSDRGDNATAASVTSATPIDIGTKGVTMAWTAGTLTAKDEWKIYCRAPIPEAYGVTSMDYGNVTVTTNSPVKCHQFEIMSGAVSMSSVKFSLQSHGSFSHHSAGDSDTYFHFGTVGAGQRGDGSGGAGTGPEWPGSAVTATDISQDKTGGSTGAPTSLYSSKNNLSVVASADDAEAIGNENLVSDLVFTSIQLGASETGSNSTINYRLYYDYTS